MKLASIALLLASALFAAPDPNKVFVETAVFSAEGGSDLYVYAKIYNAKYDAYVVTVSWSAGDQAGTVTQLVQRSEIDTLDSGYRTRMRLFVAAPRESVKVQFLRVTPVLAGPATVLASE